MGSLEFFRKSFIEVLTTFATGNVLDDLRKLFRILRRKKNNDLSVPDVAKRKKKSDSWSS